MGDSARPMSRYRGYSLLAGVVVAVVALSPSAYADDGDLFTPTGPSIVVGGTVHPPAAIVVDPLAPAVATGTGPINPAQPIAVDPRVRVAPPVCCRRFAGVTEPDWPVDDPVPVYQVEQRDFNNKRTYLDNHGRYWTLDLETLAFEQVGGWPDTKPRDLPNRDPLPKGKTS
jgi:hypothetical protein